MIILVLGFPRSGTTYFSQLLARACEAEVQAELAGPLFDLQRRQGYIVRFTERRLSLFDNALEIFKGFLHNARSHGKRLVLKATTLEGLALTDCIDYCVGIVRHPLAVKTSNQWLYQSLLRSPYAPSPRAWVRFYSILLSKDIPIFRYEDIVSGRARPSFVSLCAWERARQALAFEHCRDGRFVAQGPDRRKGWDPVWWDQTRCLARRFGYVYSTR